MDPTPARRPAPVYPLRRPHHNDRRFTVGLVIDISEVLARHGYPPLAAGNDFLRLQQAMFTAIYQPRGTQ